MSHGLPDPPPALPASVATSFLAPAFGQRVRIMLARMQAQGFDPVIAETLRSDARQRYLFGFGRDYDDGRGVVTNSPTARHSWHFFGLAVDVISESQQWDAPEAFWNALGEAARDEGLAWGGDWKRFKDLPHVQWGRPMRQSPSSRASDLFDSIGIEAVWQEIGAASR